MKDHYAIHLRVWGDWACFTRPEMKVERVSYPVMTPSAARGILEAVFWEPQVCYYIDTIRVVKRGLWTSIRRNEVQAVISMKNICQWMVKPENSSPIQVESNRTQRNMLALQEVEYIISAELHTTSLANPKKDSSLKYFSEFKRRAQQGKCFHRPALGMREFAADFEWVSDPKIAWKQRANELSINCQQPDEDLGLMLYDVFSPTNRIHGFRWGQHNEFIGKLVKPKPYFFHAKIKDSTLTCHPNQIEILNQ